MEACEWASELEKKEKDAAALQDKPKASVDDKLDDVIVLSQEDLAPDSHPEASSSSGPRPHA